MDRSLGSLLSSLSSVCQLSAVLIVVFCVAAVPLSPLSIITILKKVNMHAPNSQGSPVSRLSENSYLLLVISAIRSYTIERIGG